MERYEEIIVALSTGNEEQAAETISQMAEKMEPAKEKKLFRMIKSYGYTKGIMDSAADVMFSAQEIASPTIIKVKADLIKDGLITGTAVTSKLAASLRKKNTDTQKRVSGFMYRYLTATA